MSYSNNPTIRTAQLNLGLNVPLLNNIPSLTNPVVQFYAVGASTLTLANNNATPALQMTFYGPNANVTVDNHARVIGGISANRVTMSNNSEIIPASPGLGDLVSSILPLYSVSRYRECSATPPAAGQPPDTGC